MDRETDVELESWIIDRVLSKREREHLFLLLEAVGIPIYEDTRCYVAPEAFPYIMYPRGRRVCGRKTFRTDAVSPEIMHSVKYEYVIEQLQQKVKEYASRL